jgi:hypothetical protein
VAQWKQAGLASHRKVVQVELGAKLVCWWKCEIGLCEIGGSDWVGAASFFLTLKSLDLCVSS